MFRFLLVINKTVRPLAVKLKKFQLFNLCKHGTTDGKMGRCRRCEVGMVSTSLWRALRLRPEAIFKLPRARLC